MAFLCVGEWMWIRGVKHQISTLEQKTYTLEQIGLREERGGGQNYKGV